MKKNASYTVSLILFLLTSCSETFSPEILDLGEKATVYFSGSIEPGITITRSIITNNTLPTTNTCGEYIGIYGLTASADTIEHITWNHARTDVFQKYLYNQSYIILTGGNLTSTGTEAYYPMTAKPALAIYAYWPHNDSVRLVEEYGAVTPIDLTEQKDILYTGKVTSVYNKRKEGEEPGTILLPFKHALGSLAFRFYVNTDDAANLVLINRYISKLQIITSHSVTQAEMAVADGSLLLTPSTQKEDTLFIGVNNKSIAINKEHADTLGTCLLYPNIDITKINLITTDKNGNNELLSTIYGYDMDETSIEVKAGEMKELSFKCSIRNVKQTINFRCSSTPMTCTADNLQNSSGVTFTLDNIQQ